MDEKIAEVVGFIGGRCRDRTYDPLIKSRGLLTADQSLADKRVKNPDKPNQRVRAKKQNVWRAFARWLDRRRAGMSPGLLAKADRALLTLKHTKQRDIEQHQVVRREHLKDLQTFAEAYAARG